MSHQSASERSVEKPIVVPWKLRRERRICRASRRRRACASAMPSTRVSTLSQSMTADVGQRFGSIGEARRASRLRRVVAGQRFDRRELADRQVRRSAARSRARAPATNPFSASIMRVRELVRDRIIRPRAQSPARRPSTFAAGQPLGREVAQQAVADRGTSAGRPSTRPSRLGRAAPPRCETRCSRQMYGYRLMYSRTPSSAVAERRSQRHVDAAAPGDGAVRARRSASRSGRRAAAASPGRCAPG